MEKEILNLLNIARGELQPNEITDILSILGVVFTSDGKLETGIKIPQNKSIKTVISYTENIKEELIKLLMSIELDNELLKTTMIDTVYKINISDRCLQNLIAYTYHMDLTNNSDKFIEILLDRDSENNRYGSDIKDPESIKNMIPRILNIDKGEVYDGTCGHCNLLLESNKIAGSENIKLYGQEANLRAWMLGQINLRMHGYENFDIEFGDTLKDPKFKDGLTLKTFDYITMNIPFGMKILGYEEIQDDLYGRYKHGIPPKSSTDYAFIQHGVSSLKDTGKAAIVVPMGALFREAMERKIRTNLVNDDLIEGIISLPSLFTNTSVSVAIIILNKNKSEESKQKIFFIKADNLGEKERRITVLSDKEVNKIVDVYLDKKEEENFSKLVDIKEIQEHNYNLNISRYIVDYTIETEDGILNIDIAKFEKDTPTTMFKNIAKFERGMNLPKSVDESKKTHKAITLADIQDGELILDKLTNIELNDVKRIEKYTVNKGDILLSCRGNAIKVAVIEDIPENIIVSNNFIKITPNYNVNPYFIKAYFESPVGQYYIESIQTGTTIKVLSASDLYEIPVPMLSSEEQNKVAEKAILARHEYKEAIKRLERKLKDDTSEIYRYLNITEVINKM